MLPNYSTRTSARVKNVIQSVTLAVARTERVSFGSAVNNVQITRQFVAESDGLNEGLVGLALFARNACLRLRATRQSNARFCRMTPIQYWKPKYGQSRLKSLVTIFGKCNYVPPFCSEQRTFTQNFLRVALSRHNKVLRVSRTYAVLNISIGYAPVLGHWRDQVSPVLKKLH